MYDDLSPHAAHDRVAALLRERQEFQTAHGNAFSARMVGADLELRAGSSQRRVNFGEFSMFIRAAHKMTVPDMAEFARFTNAASALMAIMDAVASQGTPKVTIPKRAEPAHTNHSSVAAPVQSKRTPVGFRGYQ